MMAVEEYQELSMQAEASRRAWLERKDDGSRDAHTQDLGLLERNFVVLDSRDNGTSRQVAKIYDDR